MGFLMRFLMLLKREKPRQYCKKCGKVLWSKKSKELGYGPECYRSTKGDEPLPGQLKLWEE